MLTVEELKQGLRPFLAGVQAPQAGTCAPGAWLDALALRLEEGRLVVGFPHSYFARWFSMYKQASFESALARCFPEVPGVRYEDVMARTGSDAAGQARCAPAPSAAESAAMFRAEDDEADAPDPFERFIVNAKNAFPLATARKIAGEGAPGDAPVVVFCGRSGTGKTRLLQALAQGLGRRLGAGRVLMCGAAQFCAPGGGIARGARFWQGLDAVLLDDVQELAAEAARQRELAAWMDASPSVSGDDAGDAVASRGLMIFAHAGPAAALAQLTERLRTRLESGLVLELLEPDLDVRLRYLQRATRERELPLTREQLLYLAQRCAQFSLLQGLLRKVEAFAALNGRPPLQADLENIVRTGGSARPSGCREILGCVARGFNLRTEDILGARRRPDLVLARQVAMYLCRRKLGLSYPELGRAFGGRDHSTVIHAVKKIHKLLETDKVVHNLVTELENSVP
ncbi:helix-turn-helix domain-containing protein [Desulfovibrio sp.]|uniref:DnaA/Hda family protein n=1 Tax=Desulfovibrio sp. TaxID=885 RepID=UPI0023D34658|nr:helix-turn-helix domain-containing protein [Desulfovibrio sp.]MDE7240552.1 chromosomal replication initiator DnaA [Desulfovibrio sp.]